MDPRGRLFGHAEALQWGRDKLLELHPFGDTTDLEESDNWQAFCEAVEFVVRGTCHVQQQTMDGEWQAAS